MKHTKGAPDSKSSRGSNNPNNEKPSSSDTSSEGGIRFDGVQSVAEMLGVMDAASRDRLLANLQKQDPRIVQTIEDRMFLFEDLRRLPTASLRVLLTEIVQAKWVLALRNASDELKSAVLAALSVRGSQILAEELENQRPQRLSDIRAAQKQIVERAKELIKNGKILGKTEQK